MSLERRYQLVTGGRSFPKMSSALREVSGDRGLWFLGLLSCCPKPLLSLVHCKLGSMAVSMFLSTFWLDLGAPGRSEPLCGLQRPLTES